MNGYIYSPGKKNRKNQKKNRKNKKKMKKIKMLGTISGALARSLIPYHFEWLYIQSWQKKSKKSKKNRKNKIKLKKIKKCSEQFLGPLPGP